MASGSASTTGTKAPKNDMLKSIKNFFASGSESGGAKKVNLTINPIAKPSAESTPMEIEKEEEEPIVNLGSPSSSRLIAKVVVDDGTEEEQVDDDNDDEDAFEDAEQGSLFERMIDLSNKMEMGPNRFYVQIHVKYLLNGIDAGVIKYNIENRLISEERLKRLHSFDVAQSDPIILGKLRGGETYDIIDGQHRIEVLRGNLEKFGNEQIMLDIRLYKEENDFYKILEIVNNRFNFDRTNLRRFKYMVVKENLEKFSRAHKSHPFGERRPYIREDLFQQVLFKTAIFNKAETKGEEIFAKLLEVNRFLSTAMVKVDERNLSSKMKLNFDKCGLYIGLDKSLAGLRLLDVPKEKFEEKWASFHKSW